MTEKFATKKSQPVGERGRFYFAPILMTLKKFFTLPTKSFRYHKGQAATEYFVIFTVLLAVTLLSSSILFPTVKDVISKFHERTVRAIIGERLNNSPMVDVTLANFNWQGLGPFPGCGTDLTVPLSLTTITMHQNALDPTDPCAESDLPNYECLKYYNDHFSLWNPMLYIKNQFNQVWGTSYNACFYQTCHTFCLGNYCNTHIKFSLGNFNVPTKTLAENWQAMMDANCKSWLPGGKCTSSPDNVPGFVVKLTQNDGSCVNSP